MVARWKTNRSIRLRCLKVKRSGMLSGGEDPWAHLRQANDRKQRRWLGGNPTFFLRKYTFNSTFIFIIFIFLHALGTMHELSVRGASCILFLQFSLFFLWSENNKKKTKKFMIFLWLMHQYEFVVGFLA